jgi:tetratricopeptide (TPR) repeat protein
MNGDEDRPGGRDPVPFTLAERINRACDDFEADWRAGRRPRIEDRLVGVTGPARAALVSELLAVELHRRRRAGERPAAGEYLPRFPDDAAAVRAAFQPPAGAGSGQGAPPPRDSIWHERFARGEDTPASELCRSCPDLAPELERRLAVQRRMKAVLDVVAGTPGTAAKALGVPLATDEAAGNPFDRINALCKAFADEWKRGRPDLASYLDRVAPEMRAPLFRNLLEHDVRTRRQSGDVPSTEDYLYRLPPHYADLIRQVFLETSRVSVAASFDPLPAAAPAASRPGDYRLVRELGRGGMGAVFEAVHLGRGHQVALKVLPAVNGDSLHRFKREFRALADVTHPNLVGLRTLESDGAQRFITLDLLDGCNFRSYVRPSGELDEGRLRAALAQLVVGVMALHARDVVHRDLKPGNVMVTTGDRVVILDFRLVAELGRAGALSADGGVAGTPAYMAPEQAAGLAAGPPADWYAVGVMTYEALTGTRPFDGEPLRVMWDKQSRDASTLKAGPGIPDDLANLANRLISRDPASRPDPLWTAGVVAVSAVSAIGPPGAADQLIGRSPQLADLGDTLAALRRSREPVTAFVRGRSGEGKTSLVEAFLDPLREDPSVVILAGRCYDLESVPFKALDALIDALTAHLRSLPEADAARLLPDDIGLLAEVFPTLRRCDVVARAPRGRLDALDHLQVRQRAFAALRLVFDRIGERTPLVCFVDDLQWGDADSAAALFEVLRPPAAPAVLFVGNYRSDEAHSSPFLSEWSSLLRKHGVDFGDREVAVGPLSLDEAAQLVANVVGRDVEVLRRRAVQFHAESGGNPFLLVELAGCFDPDADAFRVTDIHGVLAQKLDQMPAGSGALLDAVSVSGQAVELGEAAAAADLAEPEGQLTRMRNARLLRIVGAKVDTYHDRIRYAVLDRMPDAPRRDMHRRLAEVIERVAGGIPGQELETIADGRAEPGGRGALARVYDLSYHCDAAGDPRRALAYALVAAAQARKQFALDVAAQQYAVAARNAAGAPDEVHFRIARGRGEALLQLGRYEEARSELRSALGLSRGRYVTADVRGLLGELAYKLGGTADSIAQYEDAVRGLGVRVPRGPLGLGWAIARESAVQLIHRVLPWRLHKGSPDPTADLANRLLGRLEYAYYCNNVIKLLWASLVGLNGAERLPPSPALSFNYVVHANDMSVFGWRRRASRYYQAAIDLSRELNDEWGAAQSLNHFAMGELQAGRYASALAKAEPGKVRFSKLGDLYETHLAHLVSASCHYGLGNLAEAAAGARWIFESAVRNGDNAFATITLLLWARATRGAFPFDELAGCTRAEGGNHLCQSGLLVGKSHWHRYQGRTAEAVAACEEAWEICRSHACIVAFNTCVPVELVTALRVHAEAIEQSEPRQAERILRRLQRLTPSAARLSWFLPTERPHALRELSLMWMGRGRVARAWKLAVKSCDHAGRMNARYEYAQSLLVRGRLAKQLGWPEADDQICEAVTELDRIEASVGFSRVESS